MTHQVLTTPTVGKTINRLRKSKQLTLDQLASLCGVSKSMLSQIERNETNPTLAIVWRLAEALDQTIDDLIRGEEANHSLHISGGSSIPVLNDPDGQYSLTILGPADLVNEIEWYELNLKPNGILKSDSHPARTNEHLTILEGEVELLTGEESGTVKQGETARYRADKPHSIANKTGKPVRALLVMLMGQ